MDVLAGRKTGQSRTLNCLYLIACMLSSAIGHGYTGMLVCCLLYSLSAWQRLLHADQRVLQEATFARVAGYVEQVSIPLVTPARLIEQAATLHMLCTLLMPAGTCHCGGQPTSMRMSLHAKPAPGADIRHLICQSLSTSYDTAI